MTRKFIKVSSNAPNYVPVIFQDVSFPRLDLFLLPSLLLYIPDLYS